MNSLQINVNRLVLSERGGACTLALQLGWQWTKSTAAPPAHVEVVVLAPQLKSPTLTRAVKEAHRHKEPELRWCMVPVAALGSAQTFQLEARDKSGTAVGRSAVTAIPAEPGVLESALDEQQDERDRKRKSKRDHPPETKAGAPADTVDKSDTESKSDTKEEDDDSEEAYYRPPPRAPEDERAEDEEPFEYSEFYDAFHEEDALAYELGLNS